MDLSRPGTTLNPTDASQKSSDDLKMRPDVSQNPAPADNSPDASAKEPAVVAPLRSENHCIVCFSHVHGVTERATEHCCKAYVCRACMRGVVSTKVNDGNVRIPCPNPECDKFIHQEEVVRVIGRDKELRNKYERFLVDAAQDESKKTCPRCCLITEHRLPRKFRLKEEDVKLRCASCDLEWCFKCHAPWHAGLTCKTFKTGEAQFKDWTKGTCVATNDANCRQCPTCRVYIQRNEGCDHMTCSRCESEFCYKCGGLYVPLTNHRNPLSIFGCKFLYIGHPVERVAMRGGYFAAKMAALTGYPFLLVGGAALLLVGSVVIIPIYIGYRVHKYREKTRR